MTGQDWRWKLGEVVERLRTRYEHIGRKTGAPFLAVVYPPQAEAAVLREWHIQADALRPEIDVRFLDALEVTQQALADVGCGNVVSALVEPMPGSDATAELGHVWAQRIAQQARDLLSGPGTGKPVISLEHLAALYPAAGPADVMRVLWDSSQSAFDGPVVVMIPGTHRGARTYAFLGTRDEFMYRGDLL